MPAVYQKTPGLTQAELVEARVSPKCTIGSAGEALVKRLYAILHNRWVTPACPRKAALRCLRCEKPVNRMSDLNKVLTDSYQLHKEKSRDVSGRDG